MINTKKTIVGILFLLGLSIPLLSMPQSVDAADETCGGGDYYDFIANVRSENTRRDYFEDFFTLSYCQVNDILELYDELDTLSDQFRTAAFDCEDTSTYKKQYNEILMEIYFVREIQKRDPGVTNAEDIEKINDTKDLLLEELRTEMREVFVNDEDRVSDNTFDEYFDVWSYKYYDRIGEYASCKEGAWYELTESWTSFIDTIKGLGDMDLDPAERSMFDSSKFSADVNGEESVLDPIRDTFAPNKSVSEDAEQNILIDLGYEPTLEDALSSSYSIEGAFNALVAQENEYDASAMAQTRLDEYHRLYGQGGAQAGTNLQSLIKKIQDKVDSMTTHLAAIKEKLQTVLEKQCSD